MNATKMLLGWVSKKIKLSKVMWVYDLNRKSINENNCVWRF